MKPKPTKLNKNLIIPIILMIFAIISLIIYQIFFIPKPVPPKEYQKVTIANFAPLFTNNVNFTLQNELTIDSSSENYFYQINEDQNLLNNLKTNSLKLGLSKETRRTDLNLYSWTKENATDLADNNVVYSGKIGKIEIKYSSGLNLTKIKAEDSYKFINDFFKLNFHQSYKTETKTDGLYETVTIKNEFDSKNIISGSDLGDFGHITLKDGKIIEAEFAYLDSNIEKKSELKPVNTINKSSLSQTYYFIYNIPLVAGSTSGLGSEYAPLINAKVSMKTQEKTYYFYSDENNNKYLLPAIKILGEYLDSDNSKGTVVIIVVNESL